MTRKLVEGWFSKDDELLANEHAGFSALSSGHGPQLGYKPTNPNLRCSIVLETRYKINNSVGKFSLEFMDKVSNKYAK